MKRTSTGRLTDKTDDERIRNGQMPIKNFASEMPIRFFKVHEFLLFIIDLRVRACLHNQAVLIQPETAL